MWRCPKCTEQIEENFDTCWACGTGRDGVEDPDFVRHEDPVDAGKASSPGLPITEAVTAAIVAAILGFLHPVVPSLATIHTDPLIHFRMDDIVSAGFCWALFAGIGGAVAGMISARKANTLVAAGIGAVSFVVLHIMFFGIMTPQLLSRMSFGNALATLTAAGSVGAIASVVAVIAGRRKDHESGIKSSRQFSLRELLLVTTLFAIMISCEMQMVTNSPAVAEIEKHQGRIIWTGGIDESDVFWRIQLTDSRVGDEDIVELLPILRSTRNLELDLRGSSVTDKGLRHLSSLDNLIQLWLDGKRISDSEVEKLQQTLPSAKIVFTRRK